MHESGMAYQQAWIVRDDSVNLNTYHLRYVSRVICTECNHIHPSHMESFNKGFSYAVKSDTNVVEMQLRHQRFRADWSFLEQRQNLCVRQDVTNARQLRWLDNARRSLHCGSVVGISS